MIAQKGHLFELSIPVEFLCASKKDSEMGERLDEVLAPDDVLFSGESLYPAMPHQDICEMASEDASDLLQGVWKQLRVRLAVDIAFSPDSVTGHRALVIDLPVVGDRRVARRRSVCFWLRFACRQLLGRALLGVESRARVAS